ncbi:phospholipase D family protein [Planomicrobium okeanokoites]|uniref:phospholipase D family protein n=1 Tax=Planomicrobium okeanokoites TaxID=244 RepID=UPI002492C03F|nr:phospholipase D family protein [Planomicrobium okeanokoites]
MRRRVAGWSKRKRIIMGIIGVLALMYIAVIVWHTIKPLPQGMDYAGDLHQVEDVEMIYDLSFAQNQKGDNLKHELRIFDEIYEMIDEAEEFIVIDLFLFDDYTDEQRDFPAVAETLTDHLLAKKAEDPDFPIYFITDPLNFGYGSYESQLLGTLRDEGVEVIVTDLDKLRDSTPLYSGLYRVIFQWFDAGGRGWVPNAMASDAPDLSVSSYLKMMNIKANHRKAVITEKAAIVSSANPHNASGLHGNMAFKVSGPVINDMLASEEAVSRFSGGPDFPRVEAREQQGDYQVQYVTEKKVLNSLLDDIEKTKEGDSIHLAMFYIAEGDVVQALTDAANRGVEVQLVLDPNENAFGTEKTGLPNRPAVHEMLEESNDKIQVRWYNAVVGQFHTKSIMIQTAEESYISGGSTNYTERAFKNYNLESNIRIIAPNDSELVGDMETYFDRLWTNEDALYTLHVDAYQDTFTFWQRGIYGFQKIFKLTTY